MSVVSAQWIWLKLFEISHELVIGITEYSYFVEGLLEEFRPYSFPLSIFSYYNLQFENSQLNDRHLKLPNLRRLCNQ